MHRALLSIFAIGALAVQAAEVPRPAPDFTINMPGAAPQKLSQYKGKVLAVEFLLVTCPHCQRTAQTLTKLQKELGPQGFQAIGISVDPAGNVANFAKQYGVNYPVGTAPNRDAVYSFLQHSVMSPNFYVPQMVIIDRNGVIREQHGGTDAYFNNEEASIRASLAKLLGDKPAGGKPKAKARKAS